MTTGLVKVAAHLCDVSLYSEIYHVEKITRTFLFLSV